MRRFITVALAWLGLLIIAPSVRAADPAASPDDALGWPAATSQQQPWTRWWWLGSAVDDQTIDQLLETYHEAGLGGVEITCIYGVQGQQEHELAYLSPAWVAAVLHTTESAQKLGMQVDLPPGSGWRMGGPSVTDADANATVVIQAEPLQNGTTFRRQYGDKTPQALAVFSDTGQMVELASQINAEGWLRWQVPEGNWTLYAVSQKWAGDRVKRPAPGGEGKNINPYFRPAVEHYLAHFADAAGDLLQHIRASFHDSFEYEGDWCSDFFIQFYQRRGYRLQDHLPALDGKGDHDMVARVKCDYRETLADLVLEGLIEPWVAWSHDHGMLARNQAHGSPANWLDLYAAADIPETESFGRLRGGDWHLLMFKFASSAANVVGRRLVSSETATWLDEHFTVTLGQIKAVVDQQMLGGVNHVIYHGTAYSPADASWPGWCFYASTELNPRNPIWGDLPTLNQYVTRCQSVLQSTEPDNDLLLYWPIYDSWQQPDGMRMNLRVHNVGDWFDDVPFGKTAHWLDDHGYTFDFISDRQLLHCQVDGGQVKTAGGAHYAAIVVPGARLMPTVTLRRLMKYAGEGATVIFVGGLPIGRPGLLGASPDEAWDALHGAIQFHPDGMIQTATVSLGKILMAENREALFAASGVRCESWRDSGDVSFLRRTWQDGHVYLVKNNDDSQVDGWIPLTVDWTSAAIMDPMSGEVGLAATRTTDRGHELRLQLQGGQTLFIKTFGRDVDGPAWAYREPTAKPTPLAGQWAVKFVSGGPTLPPDFATDKLDSWTKLGGPEAERFAGTARYTITFTPPDEADRYVLNLGKVFDSARVERNGKPVATLIGPPYAVVLDDVQPGENELAVEVTNVAANRIRDLDQRGVKWRIFNDINLVNISYRPFDASKWPVRDAGLLGPVTLQPLAPSPQSPSSEP